MIHLGPPASLASPSCVVHAVAHSCIHRNDGSTCIFHNTVRTCIRRTDGINCPLIHQSSCDCIRRNDGSSCDRTSTSNWIPLFVRTVADSIWKKSSRKSLVTNLSSVLLVKILRALFSIAAITENSTERNLKTLAAPRTWYPPEPDGYDDGSG
jgi:hypothetical protein